MQRDGKKIKYKIVHRVDSLYEYVQELLKSHQANTWNTCGISVMSWTFSSKYFLVQHSCIVLPSLLYCLGYWHSCKRNHIKQKTIKWERERAAFTFTGWGELSDASAVGKGQSYSLNSYWLVLAVDFVMVVLLCCMNCAYVMYFYNTVFEIWRQQGGRECEGLSRGWFFILKARARVEFDLTFHMSFGIVYPFVPLSILTCH
jgi:hypothetical protein